jgi:hypothetical protein
VDPPPPPPTSLKTREIVLDELPPVTLFKVFRHI